MNTDTEKLLVEQLIHKWVVGDVFITGFWGVKEVCIISNVDYSSVYFIRLESVRNRKKVAKDLCLAELDTKLFNRIDKTFLHHSEWYYEYEATEQEYLNQKQ